MKESYECEVATHIGPESCGAAREVGVEALTRNVRAGYSAAEDNYSGTPTLEGDAGGSIGCTDIARCARVPRGHRPRARTEAPRTGTGRSQLRPEWQWTWAASYAAPHHSLAAFAFCLSSLSSVAHGRHYLRQEPDAGKPLVRIRGGGQEQS